MSKNYPSREAGGNSDNTDEGIWDISEIEEKVQKPSQWGSIGPKTFKAFPVSHSALPAGCYSVTRDNNDDRVIFTGKYIKSDKIIRFKGGLADRFLKEIDDFWNNEKVFTDNGFLHRRGYLLYGSQGTGKSSIIWQVAQDVIKRGGIVLVCDNPKFFADGLKTYRLVEPKRPLVCVFEDIDAIIKKYGEPELLSLLDGDNQIDRVINVASTNYPEVLDKRIVARPRRFDRIYKVEAPDKATRIAFLKAKLPAGQDHKQWLEKTSGLSFASLTETIISVVCLGNDLDETVQILREIETKTLSSEKSGNIGFNADGEDDEEMIDDKDLYEGGKPPKSI